MCARSFQAPNAVGHARCKAAALLGGALAAQALGDSLEVGPAPPGQGSVDAIVVALGLLMSRVAQHAGMTSMDREAPSFVTDVRGALACAFGALREEADKSGEREVFAYLLSQASCACWCLDLSCPLCGISRAEQR